MVQHRKTRHTIFKKGKKKGIDNYYRQKANTYKWDIFEKGALIKGTQKKQLCASLIFRGLKTW